MAKKKALVRADLVPGKILRNKTDGQLRTITGNRIVRPGVGTARHYFFRGIESRGFPFTYIKEHYEHATE